MTPKEMVKAIEQSGTRVSKDKLLETLRRSPTKELCFIRDAATGYSVILVKVG